MFNWPPCLSEEAAFHGFGLSGLENSNTPQAADTAPGSPSGTFLPYFGVSVPSEPTPTPQQKGKHFFHCFMGYKREC